MTSGDTHDKTVKLLEDNNYFGMEKEQLYLLKQEKVPALSDTYAHFAQKSDNKYELQTKPHGHGDVHALMFQPQPGQKVGTAPTWLEKHNTRWNFYFQDTNGVSMRALLSTIGISKSEGYDYNSVTIPRMAGEAVGGIALLKHKDGKRNMTINVEYNQLGPLLKASGGKGDVGDKDGFSVYPGNVNAFVINNKSYCEVLKKTNGMIPEFVNPKYADEKKTTLKKATRLECMMQDYPKLLTTEHKVGITCHEKWLAKSAVKNNIKDAYVKWQKTSVPESGSSGEAGIYYCNRQYLRKVGLDVKEDR
eukprot:UN32911